MLNNEIEDTAQPDVRPAALSKRVVFTMGGKGGVGKTGVALAVADWYERQGLRFTTLDLDSENKMTGSLKHYFPDALKVNIHTPAGLDAFLDHLSTDDHGIVLADMGGGSGQVAHHWFREMQQDLGDLNISWTAIGVITPDPASVESVLTWASNLQHQVDYMIVENASSPYPDFSYWHQTKEAKSFRDEFKPTVVTIPFRIPDLEHITRKHGLTLGRLAANSAEVTIKLSLTIRAQSYCRRVSTELAKAEHLLFP